MAVTNQAQQVSGMRIKVMPLARISRVVVMKLSALISDCLPLARLPEALSRLQQGQGMQYAIDPWA